MVFWHSREEICFMFKYVICVLLVFAAPSIWEQATSDGGCVHSGARPDCRVYMEVEEAEEVAEGIRNSLPPTCL